MPGLDAFADGDGGKQHVYCRFHAVATLCAAIATAPGRVLLTWGRSTLARPPVDRKLDIDEHRSTFAPYPVLGTESSALPR